MGFRYGSLLYKHGYRVSEMPRETLAFGKKCEKEVKRIFPDILDEIRGFADACHASYRHLASFIFSIGTLKPAACSVFAVDNGFEVIFGRNYDFYYRFKRHSRSFLTEPSEGYCSVGNSDVFIGREDGVNEKGLAVAMTWVAPTRVEPGINFLLLTRCILDKCCNVKEALRILTEARHVAANNYLLADREGDMAVVEACAEKVGIRRPKNDFIVCTNHFVHQGMISKEDHMERPSDSVMRYITIYKALEENAKGIDVKAAQKILSDHEGKVCSHINEIRLGTLWSLVAGLKQLKIFIAEGHPCRAKYREDMRLNKALKHA
jgi:predicted choloylglycine hydrolase